VFYIKAQLSYRRTVPVTLNSCRQLQVLLGK